MRKHATKAKGGRAVGEAPGLRLGERSGGAPGRSHRLALARLVRRSFVCEEERLPGFSQMPLHVISQHGEEDMGLHAALKPVTDRADLKVHALERAEGAFHFGQAFV